MNDYITSWKRDKDDDKNDDLTEQAQAKKGNWKNGVEFVRNFSEDAMHDLYNFIDDLYIPKLQSEIKIYKNKHNESYVCGIYGEESHKYKTGDVMEKHFYAIFSISLEKINLHQYKNSFVVKGVAVIDNDNYSRAGIAYEIYQYFVKKMKYTLVGDSEQYFGARKLWVKLSKNIDLKVDIYDIKSNELVYKDVILHHGKYDSDFDERIWSYSKDKHNLRSILTELL